MQNKEDHLYVLWTNADLLTSQMMLLMYTRNSKVHGWWGHVTVIIWGATAKLVAENQGIQEHIKLAQDVGVQFSACRACAKQLNVVDSLENQGIEVKYWGEGLTNLIKDNAHLLTV